MNRFAFSLPSNQRGARRVAAAGAVLAAMWAAPAYAYRPFEGTDAGVAEAGVFELELGPLGYERHGAGRSIVAPAIVGNFGLPGDFEFVIEGKLNREQGGRPDGYRSHFGDTAMSIKHVLRQGSLQEKTGPSIAAECGVLLPEFHGERGTGGTCAGIVSQEFGIATVHLNAALTRTRDKANARFAGVIIEGRGETVRPVAELFAERDNRGGRTKSLLVGAIWKHSEDLVFDAGVRRAREDGVNVTELRAGLTWSYQMHK
jgi:hypothetical protein